MHFAADRKIQMIYASSASTYGGGTNGFREEPACEEALNVYAFSKLFLTIMPVVILVGPAVS